MAVEKLFYENAIAIGNPELVKIHEIASKIWANRLAPDYMDYNIWRVGIYLEALQDFLLSKGCKLQFKINVEVK